MTRFCSIFNQVLQLFPRIDFQKAVYETKAERHDFAQVEVDTQQINLTRFNLRFPEKRPFFLENSGLFTVGAAARGGGGTGSRSLFQPAHRPR